MDIPVDIIIALISVIGGYFIGQRNNKANAERTDADTLQIQRTTINALVRDIEDLRKRQDAAEEEIHALKELLREKEDTLATKDEGIAELKQTVNELKSAFKDVLQYLKDIGVEIPTDKLPRPGLLDTGDRIKAVKGGK